MFGAFGEKHQTPYYQMMCVIIRSNRVTIITRKKMCEENYFALPNKQTPEFTWHILTLLMLFFCYFVFYSGECFQLLMKNTLRAGKVCFYINICIDNWWAQYKNTKSKKTFVGPIRIYNDGMHSAELRTIKMFSI